MKISDSKNKLGAATAALDPRVMLAGTTNLAIKYYFPASFSQDQKDRLLDIAENARAWVDSKIGGTKIFSTSMDFTQQVPGETTTGIYPGVDDYILIDKSNANRPLNRTDTYVFRGGAEIKLKNSVAIKNAMTAELARIVTGLNGRNGDSNTVLANDGKFSRKFNQAQQDAINSQDGLFFTNQDE